MGWIQTISGKKFNVLEPEAASLDIEDIAYALGMLCRFNGHGMRFYSVAEHSVHVSREISGELALAGLLHDAAEAYIGDIPSPLKRHLPDFQRHESRVERVIESRYGLAENVFSCPELKRADIQLLVDEQAALMKPPPEPWPPAAPPPKNPSRIMCLDPAASAQAFLDRFNEIASR